MKFKIVHESRWTGPHSSDAETDDLGASGPIGSLSESQPRHSAGGGT